MCWLLIFPQFSFGENDLHETGCELLPWLCVRKANLCVQENRAWCLLERAVRWNRVGAVPKSGETRTDFAVRTSLFKAQRFLTLRILPELLSWHSPCALGSRLSQQMVLSLFGVDLWVLAAYWLRHMALG